MVNENKELVIMAKEEVKAIVRHEMARAFEHFEERQSKRRNKIYISRKEAAKKIGCSLPTLWKLDKNGELPASRAGTKVLYELGQIERFLENSKY